MSELHQNQDATKRGKLGKFLGLFAIAASLFATGAQAQLLETAFNEQVVMVPAAAGNAAIELETTVFRPTGDGPFPIVIMNHGKALGNPRNQSRDRFVVLSREFVKRGYAVVIPMRKGFSKSSGEYVDPGCNMTAHGNQQAEDLQSTVAWLQTQAWADSEHMIVAGQSYGGLTALAFGTQQVPGVRALINFAGGLKMHGGSCRWEQSLVDAFAAYGGQSRLPSLWFYGQNDNHFGPELASRLYQAYTQAGGQAQLVAFGPFKKDAHGMSASRDGVQIWWPETERFLRQVGMPTETVFALADEVKIPEVEYASIDNLDAIPYLRGNAREQYRVFLSKTGRRAFAVSPTGAWSWAEEGDDPVYQALSDCQKHSSEPCRLYAVDNHVVWANEAQPVTASANPVAAPTAAITGP
ncbi:MAG TPA: CocE/NonD family hydrolase [Noviherbaspirillum sp.]|jgi:dienelactone hydrolase|uniref:dienelactone hydrolase family protein n=1 Tax=Noviherbaspirillum sp. TaxID=1926288 RepID=UPI002F949B8B